MSKVLMVASAFAIAAALGASGAQAGGRHQSYGGGGLLGLNLNVGDLIGVKANVGGSNGGHNGGGDSLLGLGLRIDGLANVKANVGGSNGHGGDSLLGLGARVDGLANVKANVAARTLWSALAPRSAPAIPARAWSTPTSMSAAVRSRTATSAAATTGASAGAGEPSRPSRVHRDMHRE